MIYTFGLMIALVIVQFTSSINEILLLMIAVLGVVFIGAFTMLLLLKKILMIAQTTQNRIKWTLKTLKQQGLFLCKIK